jgi:ABC-2 type transport system permease protein
MRNVAPVFKPGYDHVMAEAEVGKMSLLTCSWQRLKLIWSQPKQFFAYFLIPILVILFAGQMMKMDSNEIEIPVAIVDDDQSEYSRKVIERVIRKPGIRVTETSQEEALSLLKTNKIEGIFIIRDSFMQNVLAGQDEKVIDVLKAPHSLGIGLISELLSSEVIRLSANVMAADYVFERYKEWGRVENSDQSKEKWPLWKEAWEYTDAQWEPVPLMSIAYEDLGARTSGIQQTDAESFIRLSGILSFTIMLLSLLSSHWIIEERQNNILSRVSTTSVSLQKYILGHSLTYLVIIFVQTLLVLLFVGYVYQIVIPISAGVMILLVGYLLACWSISVFMATILKTSAQMQVMAIMVTVLTSLFGGSFIHLADVTERFQQLSFFTPQAWLMHGIRNTVVTSSSLVIYAEMLIFLVIISFFLLVSLRRIGGRA